MGEQASMLNEQAAPILFTTVVVLLVTIVFLLIRNRSQGVLKGVPRASGSLADDVRRSCHSALTKAHQELGDTFVIRPADRDQDMVFVRDVDAVAHVYTNPVFRKNANSWGSIAGAVDASNLVQPMFTGTFFHKDGPEWKQARKDINPWVSNPHLGPVTAEVTRRWIQGCTPGKNVDILEEWHVTLQKLINILCTGEEMPEEVIQTYAGLIQHFEKKHAQPENLFNKEDADLLNRVLPHAMGCVANVRAALPKADPKGVLAKSLMALMVKGGYGDDEIAKTFVNFVIAGAESPAVGIVKTVACIALHPEVLAKCIAEVDAVVGDGELTMDHVPKLKYIENCVKEGHRRFDPATLTTRVTNEPVDMGGIIFPENQLVGVCIHAVHMNPNVWKEPERFIPERFDTDNHPYAWIPFGGGPRGCPGKRPTLVQAKIMIALLLQKFEIAPGPGLTYDAVAKHVHKFSSWNTGGMQLLLSSRVKKG